MRENSATDADGWLAAMRAAVARLQRPWAFWARMRCRTPPPRWMPPDDGLQGVYEQQGSLLRHGVVQWTVLVQANDLLFKPGVDDHPALIVHSCDPYTAISPTQLGQVAQRLYRLKHTTPADAAERRLAQMISSEMDRAREWRVPPTLTGGISLQTSACMVFRSALPDGRIQRGWLPMLALPGCDARLPVPLRCWPDALIDWWMAGS